MKQIELTPDLPLEQVVQQAQQEDIVLTSQGHAVALISEIDNDDLYWHSCERDPEFLASLIRARAQVAQGQAVPHEDLKRQLGIH
jgi:hypothetical protein